MELKKEMCNMVLECVCGGSKKIVERNENVVENICNDIGQNIVETLLGNDSLTHSLPAI